MRTAIFDLETSSLFANSGIILCCCIKEYGVRKITTIRADTFPNWKHCRSDNSPVVREIIKELGRFDILAAHNGQYFDKTWLNAASLKYGVEPVCRYKKFIDPVLLSRRHLKMGRNSLTSLIDYFEVPTHKTPIEFKHWIQASHDGNSRSLDYIVQHCQKDVVSLEQVYDKVRPLIEKIDSKGSAF